MSLVPSCPRCPAAVREHEGGWSCAVHGAVPPLWRPAAPSYDELAEHLQRADGLPTYLPWPLPPGWEVTGFGVVGDPGRPCATITAVAGPTELDGPVEVLVVSEEPGTGLGARCAGTVHSDPGEEITLAPAGARIRVDAQSIALWPISTPGASLDRSVFAGEAGGRWLWLVLRPASAMLLFTDSWQLVDVSGFGAQLLAVPFGGHPPAW